MVMALTTSRLFSLFVLITMGLYVCDMWIFSAFAENRFDRITIHDAFGIPYECSSSKYVVPHVIECIKDATIAATSYSTHIIEDYLRYPMMAFLTIAVIHFGYQMVTQEKQMQQKAIILLLKVAFVFWMTNDFGGLIPAVYAIMDEGQAIVSNVLFGPTLLGAVIPGMGMSISCPDLSSFFTHGDMWIWAHMSCVLGQLMGYGPNIALSGSLFGLLGAFMGGGALGVTIFFEGLIALVSIIMLILRAVFFYVVAYVMVGFLIMIAPIFIPLMFMKATFNYFNKWLSNLQSAMINPMIITAYLVMAMMIVDTVMFNGPDSLTGILSSPTIEECLHCDQLTGGGNVIGNPKFHENTGDLPEGAIEREGHLSLLVPTLSGSASMAQSIFGDIDVCRFECYDDEATPTVNEHLDMLGRIMIAVLKVLLVVWLLVQVMEYIPVIASQITGGGYRLNSVVSETFGKDIKGNTENAMNAARGAMMREASQGGMGPDGVQAYLGSFDDGISAGLSSLVGRRNGG